MDMSNKNVIAELHFFLLTATEGFEKMGNNLGWYVDVRDVAEALLMTYEKPEAEGRYICSSHTVYRQDLVEILRRLYPNYSYPKRFISLFLLNTLLKKNSILPLFFNFQ